MAKETFVKSTAVAAALLVCAALAGCEENTYRGNDRSAEEVPKEPAAEMTDAATAVREADPAQVFPLPIGPDEASKAVTGNEICTFRMTSSDFPVLIFARNEGADGEGKAVMKVNGKLFELTPAGTSPERIAFEADGVRAAVEPEDGDAATREAALHFKIDGAEELGFWGYYGCGTHETGS